MFDQILGFILLGLGIQSPVTAPMVKGDQTENMQEATETAEAEDDESDSGSDSAEVSSTNKPKPKVKTTNNVHWLEREFRDTISASRTANRDKHTLFRQTLRTRQEEFRLELEERKASAESRHQELKEAMELKLAAFKNSKKKEIIENVQERLTELNTKLTERATERVAKISELLDRIIEKVEEEKENGKDTTAVDAAITAAQSAIFAAQTAITNQAAKSYVVSLTSEENARVNTVSMTKLLTSDAALMHESVVAARKAVSGAIRELATLRGESMPEAIIK